MCLCIFMSSMYTSLHICIYYHISSPIYYLLSTYQSSIYTYTYLLSTSIEPTQIYRYVLSIIYLSTYCMSFMHVFYLPIIHMSTIYACMFVYVYLYSVCVLPMCLLSTDQPIPFFCKPPQLASCSKWQGSPYLLRVSLRSLKLEGPLQGTILWGLFPSLPLSPRFIYPLHLSGTRPLGVPKLCTLPGRVTPGAQGKNRASQCGEERGPLSCGSPRLCSWLLGKGSFVLLVDKACRWAGQGHCGIASNERTKN